jgi:hypothetical protein
MRRALSPFLTALALAAACSPQGPSTGAGDDGGALMGSSASVTADAACDHFFAVLTGTRCGAIAPPADAVESMRERYRTSCLARLGQKGSSWTAASVDACAAAAEVLPCNATARPPECIVAPGALPDGSSCADDAQCTSTRCARTFGTPPDGGVVNVPSCGSCAPAGAAGEPCAGGPGGGCVDGTECAGSGDAQRCVPVVAGSTKPAAASGSSSSPGPGAVTSWAMPGESCDLASACVYGACPRGEARCPSVLADGASCVAFDPATTCDAFAACTDGRCSVEYTVACP